MTHKHDAAEVYGQSRLERDNASQCFSPSRWHEECKHILQWAEEALSSCILALSIRMARITNRPWSACVQTVSLFQLYRTCHRDPHLPGRTFITQGVEWQAKSKKKDAKLCKKKQHCPLFFFFWWNRDMAFILGKGECINHRPAIFFRSITRSVSLVH